jgi:ubiquitin carboxyl-terminal hydrolase 22/27/51
MCLTCPYVGCERRGHVQNHFKEFRTHRISMPLRVRANAGIASDTGNVFCHECDDYVYDPTLEAIQRSKRVILGKRKRDADAVPSMNGTDDPGTPQSTSAASSIALPPQTCKSTPLYITNLVAGLRGIQNLGNTCYMSTILQSFIHNPIVRNHYLSDTHKSNLCIRPNCIHCTITNVFTEMYSSSRSDPAIAYGPTDFITNVWKVATPFAGTDQQDSHEFLMFLLNIMHMHHLSEDTDVDEKRCKCLAHQVFGGESQSQVTCNGCGKVNRKVEMMFDIGLQIHGKPKIVLNLGNGKKNGSTKDSPVSPSSTGSSDSDSSASQTLQDCLDK